MDPKTRSIIIGAVILLVLASVFGTVFYLGKVSKNGSLGTTQSPLDALSELQVTRTPQLSPNQSTASGEQSGLKTYTGQGFALRYPQNWGLLTCSNSVNIEFDPYTAVDTQGVVCDSAVKPITVLVGNRLNCQGETVKLGDIQTIKSKTTTQGGDTNYRWCLTLNNKNLDITHRVSSSGSRATAKDDFSAAVEQIIINSQTVTNP